MAFIRFLLNSIHFLKMKKLVKTNLTIPNSMVH